MTTSEFGWTGKILRVDLTEKRWSVEPIEEHAKRFIGGIGVGLKIFWDEVPADIGAFDPENKLIFATGPLTGTIAPASGRFEIISKSPRSYPKETVTRSGFGGGWGPELKFAGYDALILQGKADRWTNIWIKDDCVEFKNAEDYLGKDTFETQIMLRKEFEPKAKILCIGPAGETLSRLAVILSETSNASGRAGFGAVMGSKKLKAIAVRGTGQISVYDPRRLIEISSKVRKLASNNPIFEWTTHALSKKEQNEFLNKYRKRNTGCFSCSMPCFAYVDIPGSGGSQTHCTNYFYYNAATNYYGNTFQRDQAVSDGYVFANRLGLDTFEIGRMVRFLFDLHKTGNLHTIDKDLALNEYGSREFIQKFLTDISYRNGIGNILAEGAARAADQIRNSWETCAQYFPAYGAANHESVREYPGIALMWATDSRDPIIDHHPYFYLSVKYQNYPEPYRLPKDRAGQIATKLFGSPRAIDHSTFEKKPEAVIYAQNRSSVINILVVCDWVYPIFQSHTTHDRQGDMSIESQLLEAVTGNSISEVELNRIGERICNLARLHMVREGRTRKEDTLHKSYFVETSREKSIPRSDFENAKTEYYRLRGWDINNGWPTRQKLMELSLSDLINGITDMLE
jgi:aldehyde:ferredoxin oxidoreductase